MQGKHWFSLLWIASLAGAWWGGQQLAGPSSPEAGDVILIEENARLREQIAELKSEREAHGPQLEARGTRPVGRLESPVAGSGSGGGEGSASTSAGDAPESVESFDLAKIETPQEFSAAFLAFARTMLGKGRAGHLELLAWIGNLGGDENEKHFERIFARGGERAIPAAIYPVVKFAVNNEKQVMALTETFFEQAAENPAWFKDMDDDPFEIFTEGIGMLAPAIVDKKQLERMRGYAKSILEQDEKTQPKALARNRRDVERLLRLWAPPMPPEEILAKLQAGTLSEAEILSLLPTLPPEALKHVDLDRYIGPRIEKGEWRAMSMLRRFPDLDAVTRERLDQRIYRGAGAEQNRIQPWAIRQYVYSTGRRTWTEMRSFFETGLGMEGRTADTFGGALTNLGGNGRPDKEWVQWALGRFTLHENVARQLKGHFGIKD